MKRRKKNFRKRSCEEEEEETDGLEGVEKSGEKSGGDEGVRTASLQAVRAMQKMRGTKMYRETQIQVRRQADETTVGFGTTVEGRKIGLDTRENPTAGQQQPVDITDHSQRMFAVLFSHSFSPNLCFVF